MSDIRRRRTLAWLRNIVDRTHRGAPNVGGAYGSRVERVHAVLTLTTADGDVVEYTLHDIDLRGIDAIALLDIEADNPDRDAPFVHDPVGDPRRVEQEQPMQVRLALVGTLAPHKPDPNGVHTETHRMTVLPAAARS